MDWWHHQTPNKLSKAVGQMDDVAMSSGQCLFSCAWWRPDGKMKLVNGWPTNPCMKEMFPSVYLMFIGVYFFCLIHDLFCYNCLNFVFSSVHPVAACCWFSSTEFHARQLLNDIEQSLLFSSFLAGEFDRLRSDRQAESSAPECTFKQD